MGEGRRTVVWTASARDCLDEVVAFITADSSSAGERILEEILAAANSLSSFAERGRIVPEVGVETIREIFIYRYRLIYQVAAAEVRVLALLHGAMEFHRVLPQQE